MACLSLEDARDAPRPPRSASDQRRTIRDLRTLDPLGRALGTVPRQLTRRLEAATLCFALRLFFALERENFMQEMRGARRAGDGRRRPLRPRNTTSSTRRSVDSIEHGAWYVVKKLALFLPAIFLFILADPADEGRRAGGRPADQGRVPVRERRLDAGHRMARRLLRALGLARRRHRDQPVRRRDAHQAPDVHDAVGSRLGASFIVLLTGFLYAMRHPNRSRGESVGIGIQAMTMTAIVYLPGHVDRVRDHPRRAGSTGSTCTPRPSWTRSSASSGGRSSTSRRARLPGWALFLVGLGVILVSFNLIDRVLPNVSSDATASKRARLAEAPVDDVRASGAWSRLLTLSVSVALTVLVPLAAKGYVKREEALPYIMGANITTLADTLVVAMLQNTPVAAQIVLAEAIGVTIVSLVDPGVLLPAREAHPCSGWTTGSWPRTARLGALRRASCSCCPVTFLLSGLADGPHAGALVASSETWPTRPAVAPTRAESTDEQRLRADLTDEERAGPGEGRRHRPQDPVRHRRAGDPGRQGRADRDGREVPAAMMADRSAGAVGTGRPSGRAPARPSWRSATW